MQFTNEQTAILNNNASMIVNAVAGSGKTATLIAYAQQVPNNKKILYIAFNKSVKQEAEKAFQEKFIYHVQVETAHSLAFKKVVAGTNLTLKNGDYKPAEIVALFQLNGYTEKHAEYIIATHVLKFASLFCNSSAAKIADLDYLSIVNNDSAIEFVIANLAEITKLTRLFLYKMHCGEIPVTHDFYLKKWQLTNPVLPYHYILFDEAQDASAVMLSVVLQQQATKIMVGDKHQQIYGWRFANNALQSIPFPEFPLSKSFRFPNAIAQLAEQILFWKSKLVPYKPINISGLAKAGSIKTVAVIGRTNLGLLLKAISYLDENKHIERIYFEGNIQSYTYASEGASVYDILNLHNGETDKIRDSFLKSMKTIANLEEYIDCTEDVSLSMMLEMVKLYGNKIPKLIQSLKAKHVATNEKHTAEVIFSTVHKCKGLEYDAVILANDFINEEKIDSLYKKGETTTQTINQLLEEINLFYVAVTRCKSRLIIPKSLLPKGYQYGSCIEVIDDALPTKDNAAKKFEQNTKIAVPKAYSVAEKRLHIKEAYQKWDTDADKKLKEMFEKGIPIKGIATYFNRTNGAIFARIKKLGLYSES
ncbi:MAG: 3'-5' exonuclease [Chitinophagaceae bacterium]